LDLTYKNILDIVIAIIDPVEELDYKINSIEDMLEYLQQNQNRKIFIKSKE
jgi:Mg2+ and Co2+ transporter CorA